MEREQYRNEYLYSEHWKGVRTSALERAEYRCQVCNDDKLLDVHHRTYERLGAERAADVVVLCRWCHETFHNRKPRPPYELRRRQKQIRQRKQAR